MSFLNPGRNFSFRSCRQWLSRQVPSELEAAFHAQTNIVDLRALSKLPQVVRGLISIVCEYCIILVNSSFCLKYI